MKITTEYKMSVLTTLYPLLFATLAEGNDDGEVTADDVLDLFGMAVAAMIDNDSNLATPRDRRLAIEAVRETDRAADEGIPSDAGSGRC